MLVNCFIQMEAKLRRVYYYRSASHPISASKVLRAVSTVSYTPAFRSQWTFHFFEEDFLSSRDSLSSLTLTLCQSISHTFPIELTKSYALSCVWLEVDQGLRIHPKENQTKPTKCRATRKATIETGNKMQKTENT